jgi:hypothetical protein
VRPAKSKRDWPRWPLLEKGEPVAKRGRKATGLSEEAGLPKGGSIVRIPPSQVAQACSKELRGASNTRSMSTEKGEEG